jgi:hypothetical protein
MKKSVDIDGDVPENGLVLLRHLRFETEQTGGAVELAEHEAASNSIRVHAKSGLVNGTFLHQRKLFEVATSVAQHVSAATDEHRARGTLLDVEELGYVSVHQLDSTGE